MVLFVKLRTPSSSKPTILHLIKVSRHRRRTTSYPIAPARIPACGFLAPGSSEILASASGFKPLSTGQRADAPPYTLAGFHSWPIRDPWSWHVKVIEQVFEATPVETPALPPPVHPLQQYLHRSAVDLLNPVSIAFHSVVVVIPTELSV